ncbi:MAG TPA: CinA family protein, partial [Pirellulaceae bacterium]
MKQDRPWESPASMVRGIGEFLRARSWRIAVAESVTAGQLQTLLTMHAGASDYFEGGITAYQRAGKVGLLGVDDRVARECDCVSEEVARQMARGARACFQTEVSVATTGYAEPMSERAVDQPMAYVAVDITDQKPDVSSSKVGGLSPASHLAPQASGLSSHTRSCRLCVTGDRTTSQRLL